MHDGPKSPTPCAISVTRGGGLLVPSTLVIVLGLVALLSFPRMLGAQPADPVALLTAPLADAVSKAKAGNHLEANTVFMDIIDSVPGTQAAARAAYYLAKYYHDAQGEDAKALELLETIKLPLADQDEDLARRLLYGTLLIGAGKVTQGGFVLDGLKAMVDDPATKRDISLALFASAVMQGDVVTARSQLSGAMATGTPVTAETLLTLGAPPLDVLGAVCGWPQGEELCSAAVAAAIASLQAAKKPKELKAFLASLQASGLIEPGLLDTGFDATTLGVVLPLSGKYGKIGAQALEVLQWAAKTFTPFKVEVGDTGGTPDGAKAAVKALVEDKKVFAIVGPVGFVESKAATEAAVDLGIPIFPLSIEEGLDASSPLVAQTFCKASSEAEAVAVYAVETLKIDTFAIIRPTTVYGKVAADAFASTVESMGAVVIAVAPYEPKSKAFKEAFAAIAPLPPGWQKLEEEGEPLPLPTVAFSGLFVPDDAYTVRRVASYAHYWGVPLRKSPDGPPSTKAVQLLGTGAWGHERIIDKGEHSTDNGIFAGCFPSPGSIPGFEETLGYSPTAFEGQLVDTIVLIAKAMEGATLVFRKDLVALLQGAGAFTGATGTITCTGGVCLHEPTILTVTPDGIRARMAEDEEKAYFQAAGTG